MVLQSGNQDVHSNRTTANHENGPVVCPLVSTARGQGKRQPCQLMTTPTPYLFVYGTLRRHHDDLSPHPLLAGCRFISNATMTGKLYEVDGYPAAVAAPSGLVQGELFWLPNPEQTLSILDAYEECNGNFPEPHEYRRCQQLVTPALQSRRYAWVYLYNWPVTYLQSIPTGNYMPRIQAINGDVDR